MTPKPLILAVETSGRTGSAAIALGEQMFAETAFSAPMRHSAEIFGAVCGLLNRFGRKPQQIEHIYISVGPGSFTGLRIAVTLAKTMHLANSTKIVAVDTLDTIATNAIDITAPVPAQPQRLPVDKQARGQAEDAEKKLDYKLNSASSAVKKTPIDRIAVILDAKRSQFFIAVYQRNTLASGNAIHDTQYEKILPDCLMTASQFLDRFAGGNQPIWLLGEGLVYYKDKFRAQGVRFLDESTWYPKAAKVHLLGWQMALAGRFADALTLQPTYLRGPEIGKKRKP